MTSAQLPKATSPAQHWLFLVNPLSGHCDFDTLSDLIRAKFADQPDRQLTLYPVETVGKIDKTFGKAIKQGQFTHVVAAGGDGTVRQALTLVARHNPSIPLGILPVGTGNLLAKYFHLPEKAEDALDVLLLDSPLPIHITAVNHEYAAMVAGVGLDADIMANSTSRWKRLLGPLAYILSALKTILIKEKAVFILTIDGHRRIHRGEGVIVLHRNAYARAFLPVELVEADTDEWLDICVIRTRSKLDAFKLTEQLMWGHYNEPGGVIRHYRGQKVKIRSLPRQACQLDGDVTRLKSLNIRLLKNHIRILIDPDCYPVIRKELAEIDGPELI